VAQRVVMLSLAFCSNQHEQKNSQTDHAAAP
jgi:hypothetical protein